MSEKYEILEDFDAAKLPGLPPRFQWQVLSVNGRIEVQIQKKTLFGSRKVLSEKLTSMPKSFLDVVAAARGLHLQLSYPSDRRRP